MKLTLVLKRLNDKRHAGDVHSPEVPYKKKSQQQPNNPFHGNKRVDRNEPEYQHLYTIGLNGVRGKAKRDLVAANEAAAPAIQMGKSRK